jgi:hypothetical protein
VTCDSALYHGSLVVFAAGIHTTARVALLVASLGGSRSEQQDKEYMDVSAMSDHAAE